MNKLYILIYVFLLCLFSSVVLAAPPFQSSAGTVGLTIEQPAVEFFRENSDAVLHTHVFNSTNGVPVFNDTVGCHVHLYNDTGSHIMEKEMGFSSNGEEWKENISGTNFSKSGSYSYIIWCNTSKSSPDGYIGGFVRGGFSVTEDGKAQTSKGYLIIAGVIGASFLAFLFLYFALKIDDNHFLLKLMFLFLFLGTIMVIPNILLNGKSAFDILLNLTLWTFRIFVIYFFVYLFWHWIQKSDQMMNLIGRGRKEE